MFEVNNDTRLIKMYGIIGDDVKASDFVDALESMEGQDVTIRVQSEGGDVIDGMSIANAIASYPGHVRVEIDALAASIATVFPMEADEVAAYPNSMMMIHNAWTVAVGNANSLRMTAQVLEQLDGTIASIYARKTGGKASVFRALMNEETFLDIPKAMELGLVDSVIEGTKAKKPKAVARKAVAFLPKNCSELKLFAQLSPSRPKAARVEALLHSLTLALK